MKLIISQFSDPSVTINVVSLLKTNNKNFKKQTNSFKKYRSPPTEIKP